MTYVHAHSRNHVWLAEAHQASLSMGFPRQQYWLLLLLLLSCFSHIWLSATPETADHQAPPSLGFSRQEHWSGLLFPSPGDLPNPGIVPTFSCTSRQIIYHWVTREAPHDIWSSTKIPMKTSYYLLKGKTFCWRKASVLTFLKPNYNLLILTWFPGYIA